MTLNGETQHLNSWTDSGTPGTIIDFKAISVGDDGKLTFSVQGTDQNCVALNYLTLTQKDKSVPEPSTVLLSVVALGGLLLRRRRNK
ncbi:MAG: PEP-CTERM sorting domain-containing protein [Akkermansia sp.]